MLRTVSKYKYDMHAILADEPTHDHSLSVKSLPLLIELSPVDKRLFLTGGFVQYDNAKTRHTHDHLKRHF